MFSQVIVSIYILFYINLFTKQINSTHNVTCLNLLVNADYRFNRGFVKCCWYNKGSLILNISIYKTNGGSHDYW